MEMAVHSQFARETFICEILENMGTLGQKCIFLILLGFNDNKVLLKSFTYSHSDQERLSNNVLITQPSVQLDKTDGIQGFQFGNQKKTKSVP